MKRKKYPNQKKKQAKIKYNSPSATIALGHFLFNSIIMCLTQIYKEGGKNIVWHYYQIIVT